MPIGGDVADGLAAGWWCANRGEPSGGVVAVVGFGRGVVDGVVGVEGGRLPPARYRPRLMCAPLWPKYNRRRISQRRAAKIARKMASLPGHPNILRCRSDISSQAASAARITGITPSQPQALDRCSRLACSRWVPSALTGSGTGDRAACGRSRVSALSWPPPPTQSPSAWNAAPSHPSSAKQTSPPPPPSPGGADAPSATSSPERCPEPPARKSALAAAGARAGVRAFLAGCRCAARCPPRSLPCPPVAGRPAVERAQ
jgi:hypothetical protein